MPFKSKAQQRWMYAAEDRGEVPEGTAEEWSDETDFDEIPEKVKKKEKRAHVEMAEEIAFDILEKAAAASRGGFTNALHNQYHKLTAIPAPESRKTSVTSFPRNAIKAVTTAPNAGMPKIPSRKADIPSSSLMSPPSVPNTPAPKAIEPPKPTKPPAPPSPKIKNTVHNVGSKNTTSTVSGE